VVYWWEDGDGGGEVLCVGLGEECEECGSVEFGSVEFVRGLYLIGLGKGLRCTE